MADFDNIEEAYAGLKEDWFHTSDCIFKNGVIQKGDCLLISDWATPTLTIAYKDKVIVKEIDCWTMDSLVDYTGNSVWPKETLKLWKYFYTIKEFKNREDGYRNVSF